MGNAIFKITRQTKDRSGISNSRKQDERKRRSKGDFVKPKSDKPDTSKENAYTGRSRNSRSPKSKEKMARNKERTKMVDRTRQTSVKKDQNTRKHCKEDNTSREKKASPVGDHSKSSHKQFPKIANGKMKSSTQITLPDEKVHNIKESAVKPALQQCEKPCFATRTNNTTDNGNTQKSVFDHAQDIMLLVDEWKKEEARLQKDYEDTQHRIRMSLRQEYQAKAQAQNWRTQLERLANCHRERLFRQATLLRDRLRSAERRLISTENKAKGLARTNDKLKGMIDTVKQEVRSVRLEAERRRACASTELKQKLASVESELQKLTEKIASSGVIENVQTETGSRAVSSSGANFIFDSHVTENAHIRMPTTKNRGLSEPNGIYGERDCSNRQNEGLVMASGMFPEPNYRAFDLPAVHASHYFGAPYSRHFPYLQYNSYPFASIPQHKTPNATPQRPPWFIPLHASPTKQATKPCQTPTDTPVACNTLGHNTARIPASSKSCCATGCNFPCHGRFSARYSQANQGFSRSGGAGVVPTIFTSANALDSPPSYPAAVRTSLEVGGAAGHIRAACNKRAGSGEESSVKLTVRIPSSGRQTTTTNYETSSTRISPCEKCQSLSEPRLVVAQREVYNAYARSRDGAVAVAATPYPNPGNFDVKANGRIDVTPTVPISVWLKDEQDRNFLNTDKDTYRPTEISTTGAKRVRATPLPNDTTRSSHASTATRRDSTDRSCSPPEPKSAPTPYNERGYFGDFERSLSSLAVRAKRRIVHRRPIKDTQSTG